MYERKSNSEHTVQWKPDDEDAAAQAIADTDGTGVNLPAEAIENANVDLLDKVDVARSVRERYAEIVEAKQS